MKPCIYVHFLQFPEWIVRRFEFDELDNICFLFNWTRIFTTLLHLFATQVLERDLKEMDGIFIVKFIKKETNQILQLFLLQVVSDFLVFDML